MRLTVYGPGCTKCVQTEQVVKQAVEQAGIEAEIEHVSDIVAMAKAGILVTPALAIDGKVVMKGEVPEAPEVVSLITSALAEGRETTP
jgi:small redox-active disulfide protein 2